jgi:site-specific recombinase
MFKAALGGGVIVGFLCIFKILISKLEISEFGYAFYTV